MRCVICGYDSDRVQSTLTRWNLKLTQRFHEDGKTPLMDPDTPQYGTVERCRDVDECRARCEAIGDVWPVDDSRADPLPKPRWQPQQTLFDLAVGADAPVDQAQQVYENAAAGPASVPDDDLADDPAGVRAEAATISTMFD